MRRSHNQRTFWGNTGIGCYIHPGISVNTYRRVVVPRQHGWQMMIESVGCPRRASRAVNDDIAFYYSHHQNIRCSTLCFGYKHTPTETYRPIFTFTRSHHMGRLCATLPREVISFRQRWSRKHRNMVRSVLALVLALPIDIVHLIATLAY